MPILANVLLDRERQGGEREARARGDGPRGGHPGLACGEGREARRAHGLRPQALRHRARAPRRNRSSSRPRRTVPRPALRARALHAGRHERRGVSEPPGLLARSHGAPPGRGALADDRAHDVRRVDRRDAIQPERRIFRSRRGQPAHPHGGDRRSPPLARRAHGRPRCRGPRQRRDHPAQGPRRAQAAGRRGGRRRDRARLRGQQRPRAQGRRSRS